MVHDEFYDFALEAFERDFHDGLKHTYYLNSVMMDFHCGYMNTSKFQTLLNYQKHMLEDYYTEVKKKIGPRKHFMPAIRWVIWLNLLKRSERYRSPNCSSIYCKTCAKALIEMENVCWSCESPIDKAKPVKILKQTNENNIIDRKDKKS